MLFRSHVPGTKMIQSDALSRRPDLCPKEDNDNENVTLLPERMFIRLIDTDLRDLIAQTKNQDRVIVEALEALKTCGTPPMQSALSDWRTGDNGSTSRCMLASCSSPRCSPLPNEKSTRSELKKKTTLWPTKCSRPMQSDKMSDTTGS